MEIPHFYFQILFLKLLSKWLSRLKMKFDKVFRFPVKTYNNLFWQIALPSTYNMSHIQWESSSIILKLFLLVEEKENLIGNRLKVKTNMHWIQMIKSEITEDLLESVSTLYFTSITWQMTIMTIYTDHKSLV